MAGGALCVAGLSAIEHELTEAAKQACREWGDDVLEESGEHFVPFDTGLLKSTRMLIEIKNTLTEFYLRMSYGGPAFYAAAVHERAVNHPHGTWKYLSTPFNNHSMQLMWDIGEAMAAKL
jgi:hypothetical protein